LCAAVLDVDWKELFMAKKPTAAQPEVVIDEQILRSAKMTIESERARPAVHCVICGGEAAPTSSEELCWVCRRLKISAWRDVDPQIPAQE